MTEDEERIVRFIERLALDTRQTMVEDIRFTNAWYVHRDEAEVLESLIYSIRQGEHRR